MKNSMMKYNGNPFLKLLQTIKSLFCNKNKSEDISSQLKEETKDFVRDSSKVEKDVSKLDLMEKIEFLNQMRILSRKFESKEILESDLSEKEIKNLKAYYEYHISELTKEIRTKEMKVSQLREKLQN